MASARADAANLWDDAAARRVADRFLTPMETDIDSVVGHIRKQENSLEESAGYIAASMERGRLAAGHATRALDEIDSASSDLDLALDYMRIGADNETLAAGRETRCRSLLEMALAGCSEVVDESGETGISP